MPPDLPSQQQQEMTARRYRGQRALVAPEVVQEGVEQVEAPKLTNQQRRKRIFHQISLVLTIVAVVFIWYGWKHPHRVLFNETAIDTNVPDANQRLAPQAVSPPAFGLVLLLGYWAIVCSFLYARAVLRLTGEATRPIPSLAEIEVELRRSGYNPTIQDVIAVEQHLKSERNEALLAAGALIIGPQLLARQAKGKPLL